MVGQKKLIAILNTLTLNTLPHSLILNGPVGCGKHTYINLIADKLCIDIEDISDQLSDDKILDINTTGIPKLYIISSDKIKDKDQNILLKLLEEPSDFAYICIISNSLVGLLPTIINRCHIWTFEKYTVDELRNFSSMEETDFLNLINILNTPGKLLNSKNNINNYIDQAKQIFQFIDQAIISNVLVLLDKVSYTIDDDSKLLVDTFADILNSQAQINFLNKTLDLNAVVLTSNFVNDLKIFNIDKKKLYTQFLIDLKDDIKRFKGQN